MERYCDLRQKEVINICDGARLGKISDLVIDTHNGRILKIIVGESGRFLNLFCCDKEYRIPWPCIRKIGDDIILVEIIPEDVYRDCDGKCD